MNLKEALEQIQYCDDMPLVRQCMICHEYLDEQSEIIADVRSGVEYLISHGCHEECQEKWLNGEIIT